MTNLFTNYYLGDITNYTGATYVDVINEDGSDINTDIVVKSTIINDPKPSVETTPCGCIPTTADDALSVCIETISPPISQPCETLANQPTKDDDNGYYVFQKYQYNQDGSIFTQNSTPVLSTSIFIDKKCCTALNGISSYTDYVESNNVSSGYACCFSNKCGCSIACNWYLTNSPILINGVKFLNFKTLFGNGIEKVVMPDSSNCPTRWSTPIPNIIDPHTGENGVGCKVNSTGLIEYNIMVDYFRTKADGGTDTAKCCAFTPELYLTLITN